MKRDKDWNTCAFFVGNKLKCGKYGIACKGLPNSCAEYKDKYGEPLENCKHYNNDLKQCKLLMADAHCRWTDKKGVKKTCGFYPQEIERRRIERLNGSKLYCSGKDFIGEKNE